MGKIRAGEACKIKIRKIHGKEEGKETHKSE